MPNKEDFYSSLNIEVATDVDYRGEKIIYKELKMNNLDNYHKLYVQSDTLWLTDVFENFKNKNFEIYELDTVNFLSASGVAWRVSLKEPGIKLELLNDKWCSES